MRRQLISSGAKKVRLRCLHRFGAVLFIAACLSGMARAQDLAAMNRATVATFSTGDLKGALKFGEAALAAARGADDPAQDLEALNNLGFLLLQSGGDDRAGVSLTEALQLADASGLTGRLTWFLALQNSVTVAQHKGRKGAALALLDRFVTEDRTSIWAADILSAAAGKFFELGQFPAMAAALDEMVAQGGSVRASTSLDALYGAQQLAEREGRTDDALVLIDARMTLVQAIQPGEAKEFAQAGQ